MQHVVLALGVLMGGLFYLLLAPPRDYAVPSKQPFRHRASSIAFVPHKAEIRNLQQQDISGFLRPFGYLRFTWPVTLFGRRLPAPTAPDDQRHQLGPQDSSTLVPRPLAER